MTPHSPIPLYAIVVLSSGVWLAQRRRVRGTGWFLATVAAMCALSAFVIWLMTIQLRVTH